MRLTMPDLIVAANENGIEVTAALYQMVIIEQPADPFDGLGDFEYHPTACALMREREQSLMLARRLVVAEVGLMNVEAILDRPLSKQKNHDLKVMIGAARDALAEAKERMDG